MKCSTIIGAPIFVLGVLSGAMLSIFHQSVIMVLDCVEAILDVTMVPWGRGFVYGEKACDKTLPPVETSDEV